MLDLYTFYTKPNSLDHFAQAKTSIPEIAWQHNTDEEKRALEPLWKRSSEFAWKYADEVLKDRFPAGEAAIAQDPDWACNYVRYVLLPKWNKVHKGEPFPGWKPGEKAMARTARTAYEYAWGVIKKPFPLGEPVLARSEYYHLHYATQVLKLPRPEADAWAEEYLNKRHEQGKQPDA